MLSMRFYWRIDLSFDSQMSVYLIFVPQVLSWYPRALYFPNFASAEQCESIIEMAREGLKPSTLMLRKGETEASTKEVRTRYCVCFVPKNNQLYGLAAKLNA